MEPTLLDTSANTDENGEFTKMHIIKKIKSYVFDALMRHECKYRIRVWHNMNMKIQWFQKI